MSRHALPPVPPPTRRPAAPRTAAIPVQAARPRVPASRAELDAERALVRRGWIRIGIVLATLIVAGLIFAAGS